jgi:hypothetical protein
MNHVWAYDFVFDTCANNQTLKCLTIVDEWTRECLAIDVAGGIRSGRLIEVLTQLVSVHGAPRYLRSDNGRSLWPRRSCAGSPTPASTPRLSIGETLAAWRGSVQGLRYAMAQDFGLPTVAGRIRIIAGWYGVRVTNLTVLALDCQFAAAVVAQDVVCAIDRGGLSVGDCACPICSWRPDFPTAIFALLDDSSICPHSRSP